MFLCQILTSAFIYSHRRLDIDFLAFDLAPTLGCFDKLPPVLDEVVVGLLAGITFRFMLWWRDGIFDAFDVLPSRPFCISSMKSLNSGMNSSDGVKNECILS